jgi:hypothetical protein
MPDYRAKTGSRGPTQGAFTKPGFFYPSPSDPVNDYGLVERKTVDSKEQPVAYLTAHPSDANLLLCKQEYTDNEDGKKTRTRIYRTLPGKKTTRYLYDDDLAVFIAIDTQDVAIGSAAPTDSLILQAEDGGDTSQGWITRQVIRLTALPATKVEYKTEQFTFPAILTSLTATKKSYGKGKIEVAEDEYDYRTDINTAYLVIPVIRPAVSGPTRMRIVTEFFSSTDAPAPDAIYEILPNNPRCGGKLLNFNCGEVLNDAISLSAAAATNDMSLYGLTEEYTLGASTPDATTYTDAIGTEKLLASDVARFRGDIWTKTNTYVTLR